MIHALAAWCRMHIKESDWKHFKDLHPLALDRFAQRCLAELQYHITEKSKPAPELFWEIAGITKERGKELCSIFDDFRRSTAILQIAIMRRHTLITDAEMATFSPETREQVHGHLKISR